MKLYPYLKTDGDYRKDDRVMGRVYEISRNFGAFVAVDDLYSGSNTCSTSPVSVPSGTCLRGRSTFSSFSSSDARYTPKSTVFTTVNYLPEGYEICQMRAEYKKQALLGDEMYPVVYAGDAVTVVSLDNGEGEAYCVVEFRQKMENGQPAILSKAPLHPKSASLHSSWQ